MTAKNGAREFPADAWLIAFIEAPYAFHFRGELINRDEPPDWRRSRFLQVVEEEADWREVVKRPEWKPRQKLTRSR